VKLKAPETLFQMFYSSLSYIDHVYCTYSPAVQLRLVSLCSVTEEAEMHSHLRDVVFSVLR